MSEIKTVALAGVGNIGEPILRNLLKSGFDVTVLSRKPETTVPAGAKVKVVDYDSAESLKAALTGIDAVVCTIATAAAKTQFKLIDAAVAAGVKRFIPSEFGSDTLNANASKVPAFKVKLDVAEYVEKASKTSPLTYTLMITGPFLEFCLSVGFLDVKKDGTARLYDGGDTPFTVSTMDRVGEATAAVLKHPAETANRGVYTASVTTTQNEIIGIAKKLGKTEWIYSHVKAEDVRQQGYDNFKSDPSNAMAWMVPMIQGGIFSGKPFNADYDPVDNERLGLKLMSDAELEAVVKECLL